MPASTAPQAPPQEIPKEHITTDPLAQKRVATERVTTEPLAPEHIAHERVTPEQVTPERRRGADTRALTQLLFGQLKTLEPGTTEHDRVRGALIEANLLLVRYAAARFRSRNEPMEDVVQVGTIGLINAIDRFDPDRGVQFPTFAMPTVVGEIKRYFRDNVRTVHYPSAARAVGAGEQRDGGPDDGLRALPLDRRDRRAAAHHRGGGPAASRPDARTTRPPSKPPRRVTGCPDCSTGSATNTRPSTGSNTATSSATSSYNCPSASSGSFSFAITAI